MKKYIVNVNGTSYEVSLEQVSADSVSAAPAAAPAQAPAPAPAAAPVASGEKIESPMPGTILSVNVKDGQAVKKGDVLVVLEAMKMENEIQAPVDGTVQSLSVSAGASVDSGALICVIA